MKYVTIFHMFADFGNLEQNKVDLPTSLTFDFNPNMLFVKHNHTAS